MVLHGFNTNTWKAEVGISLCVLCQPGLQSEFQASHGYLVRICLETNKLIKLNSRLTNLVEGPIRTW